MYKSVLYFYWWNGSQNLSSPRSAHSPCLHLHLVFTCPLFVPSPCLHLHLACKKLHKLREASFPSSSLFSPLTAWCFLLFSNLLEMRWRRIFLSLQWVFCLRCISISSLFTVQSLSVLHRSLAFWVSANLCVSFLSIGPRFLARKVGLNGSFVQISSTSTNRTQLNFQEMDFEILAFFLRYLPLLI